MTRQQPVPILHPAAMMNPEMDRFRRRVYRLVRLIPAGRVATYGQIATLAGHPRRARHVGHALARLPGDAGVPWHRVINAQGRISARGGSGRGADQPVKQRQARLLEKEGVRLRNGRVALERYGWRPEEEGGRLLSDKLLSDRAD